MFYNEFMLNDTSVSVAVVLAICVLPRLLYTLFANKRSFPDTMYKRQYLLAYIIYVLSGLGSIPLALFFSQTFIVFGLFVFWIVLTFVILGLILLLWIFFFMHGYDVRYLFKRILVPSPIVLLESLLLIVSGIFSLNYFLIIDAVLFLASGYLWSFKGFKITKPKTFDEPEQDLEEY